VQFSKVLYWARLRLIISACTKSGIEIQQSLNFKVCSPVKWYTGLVFVHLIAGPQSISGQEKQSLLLMMIESSIRFCCRKKYGDVKKLF